MKNHACAIVSNGHHTDIALKVYSNRIFIIVTHYKKFGTLISVNRQSALDQFDSETYSTKVLFGKDDIELLAAARFIAEQIKINKPLLISISLRECNREILTDIVSAINKIKPW